MKGDRVIAAVMETLPDSLAARRAILMDLAEVLTDTKNVNHGKILEMVKLIDLLAERQKEFKFQ